MTVDNGLLNRLEALTKIKLDESSRERFRKDLNEIIGYADTLRGLDCGGTDILRPAVTTDGLRNDETEASENPEKLLENAKAKTGGCFETAKTVE